MSEGLQIIGDFWLENPHNDYALTEEDRAEIRKRVIAGLPTPFLSRIWEKPHILYHIERSNQNTVIVRYVTRNSTQGGVA